MDFNDVNFFLTSVTEEHDVWGKAIVVLFGTPYEVNYNVDLMSGIANVDSLPDDFNKLPDPRGAFEALMKYIQNSIREKIGITCPITKSKCIQ